MTSLRHRAVALLSLAVLAGCGGTGGAETDVADVQGQAEEVLCDQRFQARESLQALRDLDFSAATVEQVTDQVEQVAQDVETITEEVGEEASTQLQQAFDQLEQAIADVDEQAVAEAEPAVDQAVDEVDAAWMQAMQTVDC